MISSTLSTGFTRCVLLEFPMATDAYLNIFRMASFAVTLLKDRDDDYVAYTRFTKHSVLLEYVYD